MNKLYMPQALIDAYAQGEYICDGERHEYVIGAEYEQDGKRYQVLVCEKCGKESVGWTIAEIEEGI